MLIIGHRGAKAETKPNTIEAVKHAIDSGVDMVEFDVMTTQDDVPVLHHGLRFSAWGRKQLPEVLTYDLLKALRPSTTRLDDVLDLCIEKKVGMDIDIKTRRVDAIVNTVRGHCKTPDFIDNFFFSSHMMRPLKRIQKRWPEAHIATYSLNPFSWLVRKYRLNLFAVGFPKSQRILIQPIAHKLGLRTYTYSVNNHDLAKKYKKYGTWAIITNRPSRVIDVAKPSMEKSSKKR